MAAGSFSNLANKAVLPLELWTLYVTTVEFFMDTVAIHLV